MHLLHHNSVSMDGWFVGLSTNEGWTTAVQNPKFNLSAHQVSDYFKGKIKLPNIHCAFYFIVVVKSSHKP